MTATAPPIPEAVAGQLVGEGRTSLWRDTLGNILRQRNAVVGLTILTFFILVAIFADQVATHDPIAVLLGQEEGAKKLAGPAAQPEHYFGIDQNVRDVFSRVVHGTRISLQIGFLTVGFAIVIGTLIGAVSGYAGGKGDNILMRLMDVIR